MHKTDALGGIPEEEIENLVDMPGWDEARPAAAPLFEEYIKRFAADADRSRVKLAVLYVKFLEKPQAALKLLAGVDGKHLPGDYQKIARAAKEAAQQSIAEGFSSANE